MKSRWSLPGALVVAACATHHVAQPAPSLVNPLPLHGEASALNRGTGAIVLVGGSNPDRRRLDGTWEWNGQWRQTVDSAHSPFYGLDATMGYDPSSRATVLYAIDRLDANRRPDRCATWQYKAHHWTQLTEGACLTTRWRNLVAVSGPREHPLLLADGPSLPGDTALRPLRLWSLKGNAWTLIDSSGPRRSGFSRVVYDDARGVLVVPVLYGGPDAGTWEWNGRVWKRIPGEVPSIRQTYGLVYDSRARRVVLAGGQGASRGPYYGDVWSWDGLVWTKWPDAATAPPGRGGGNFVFDERANRFVYFGGYNESPLNDLWVFSSRAWRRIDP